MPGKAYSYLRLSTPEQMRGDSYRRQTELAERYAADHGLILDRELRMADEGVSAFRAKNVRQGALARFLRAIDDDLVPAGSFLLVENLDRVSRADPWDAMPVFQQIINAGVIIVTLQDGKVWSQKEMRENPFRIFESLMVMIRANEESQVKSRRLKAAWERKRVEMATKPVSARAPAWLALDPKTQSFQLIPERADVVRRVFSMASDGIGQHKIAESLNKEGIPCFGRAAMWHRSYVKKILDSPAVIGTAIPHTIEHIGDRKVRRPQEAVPGYFPAAIDPCLFARVRAQHSQLRAPATRSGEHQRSLLAGLARCPVCKGSMTRVTKGPRNGRPYLVCARAKVGAGCEYRAVHQSALETSLLRHAEWLMRSVPITDEQEALDDDIDMIQSSLQDTRDTIANLVDAIAASPSHALAQRLRHLEDQEEQLTAEKSAVTMRRAALSSEVLHGALRDLADEFKLHPLSTSRVNALLRQLFAYVVVNYGDGVLAFHWRHMGERAASLVPFAAPSLEL